VTEQLSRARLAVQIVFAVNGFTWGSYVPRIPDIKERFELSNSTLGLTLLTAAVGVLLALRISGSVCARYGSATVTRWAQVATAATSLFALGFAAAFHDVAMNTHGATVERLSQRSLMNGFHARYSLGGFAGAAFGGLCTQWQVSTLNQTLLAAVGYLAVIPWLRSAMLPTAVDRHDPEVNVAQRPRQRAWIFYALGFLGLFSTIGEGAAADWGAVLLREEWGASPFVSSVPYIAFSALMVVGRLSGDRLTDRFSREVVVRTGGLAGGCGLAVGLLIGGPFGVSLGWALLGAGLSVAIPSVFSAAAQIASHRFAGQVTPSTAVAIVGTVSYAGFLGGPPTLGFLADVIGLRWAMLIPALLALGMGAAARLVRD
jgi:fucose permease